MENVYSCQEYIFAKIEKLLKKMERKLVYAFKYLNVFKSEVWKWVLQLLSGV